MIIHVSIYTTVAQNSIVSQFADISADKEFRTFRRSLTYGSFCIDECPFHLLNDSIQQYLTRSG